MNERCGDHFNLANAFGILLSLVLESTNNNNKKLKRKHNNLKNRFTEAI